MTDETSSTEKVQEQHKAAAPAVLAASVPPTVESSEHDKPVKFYGLPIPDFLQGTARKIGDWGARFRRNAIEKAPASVVNHSSNIIGSFQLVAEVLMFKSSGLDLVNPENRSKPLHYLIDPVKNIIGGVFQKAKFKIKGNVFEGELYKNGFKSLNDLEAATIRDRIGASGEIVKLTNKWSARSGFAGICAMTIATFLPDGKDTPEETQAMVKMSREHPLAYAGRRLSQAINPLEWVDHKRQFSGLGMMLAGILSVVSGFRQVSGKIIGEQSYMRNGWQMAGGVITTFGGAQLLLAVDNDQGWRNFGLTQMLRLITLPHSILSRFKGTEQGAEWYLAGQGVFQTKNVFAAAIGGAEKSEDGKVVDHSQLRAQARKEVTVQAQLKKEKSQGEPSGQPASSGLAVLSAAPSYDPGQAIATDGVVVSSAADYSLPSISSEQGQAMPPSTKIHQPQAMHRLAAEPAVTLPAVLAN